MPDIKALERKLAEIDDILTGETLSLSEEKKLIAEREALHSSKPHIIALSAKKDDIAAKKKAVQEGFDAVKALSAHIDELKKVETAEKEAFEALKARHSAEAKPAGQSPGEQLDAMRAKRDAVSAELQTMRDDYFNKLREYRAYENQRTCLFRLTFFLCFLSCVLCGPRVLMTVSFYVQCATTTLRSGARRICSALRSASSATTPRRRRRPSSIPCWPRYRTLVLFYPLTAVCMCARFVCTISLSLVSSNCVCVFSAARAVQHDHCCTPAHAAGGQEGGGR